MVPVQAGRQRAGPDRPTCDNAAVTLGEAEQHRRSNAALRWSLMVASAVLALASVALIAVRWPEQKDATPAGTLGGALGAGLAFRCADTSNCWTMSIVPQLASVAVFRTQGGTMRLVRNLGPLGDADSITLSVKQSGHQITFMVNDDQRAVLIDDHLAGERGIGLTALRLTTPGRTEWTDFSVQSPDGVDQVDPLRQNEVGPLDLVRSPFSWRRVSGRWIAGPDGAQFSRHGGKTIELVLAEDSIADATVAVTLTGLK